MSLFDGALQESKTAEQAGFNFPVPLVDKYTPKSVSEFLCEKPRNIMSNFVADPYPSNWFFLGASGTGKTTMALAMAKEIPAQVHHIGSQECNVAAIAEIRQQCHFMPRMFSDWSPCKMHLVIVDEADQMSNAAELAFLSILDSAKPLPNTAIVFTGNSRERLADRFMSRCKLVEFSSHGLAPQIAALLARVWAIEAGDAEPPNFARMAKDSKNNVRDALNCLEVELMAVPKAKRKPASAGMLVPVAA